MPNDVVTRAIDAVCKGDHLTADHAAAVLAEIMEGRADEVQTGAFLIALRAKGETVPELVGLARTMRSLAAAGRDLARAILSTRRAPAAGPPPSTSRPRRRWSPPAPAARSPSTATAPTPAAAAPPICSRRSASTSSSTPTQVGRCIDEVGFGFMFAPRHHAAMAHVVPVRKALGVRTIFNFLGPLTNPAGAERQLLGVSDRHYQETIAEALVGLGSVRAMVVAAEDGVDELSISARTRVIEVAEGRTEEWFVEPGEFGLAAAELEQVAGGSPEENAAASRAVLAGEDGPRRDLVLLNAGAAIYVGGLAAGLGEGVEKAAEAIDSGAARELLDRLVATTAAAVGRLGFVSHVGMIEQLIAAARAGVEERRSGTSQADLESRLPGRGDDRPFSEALVRPGLSVIAEFKRRSPSAGEISRDARPSPSRSAPTSAAARRPSRC